MKRSRGASEETGVFESPSWNSAVGRILFYARDSGNDMAKLLKFEPESHSAWMMILCRLRSKYYEGHSKFDEFQFREILYQFKSTIEYVDRLMVHNDHLPYQDINEWEAVLMSMRPLKKVPSEFFKKLRGSSKLLCYLKWGMLHPNKFELLEEFERMAAEFKSKTLSKMESAFEKIASFNRMSEEADKFRPKKPKVISVDE